MGKTTILLAVCAVLAVTWLCCTGCSRPQEQQPAMNPPLPGPGAEPGAPPAGGTTINQVGSNTLLALAEKWREEFNKLHPEVNIAVSGEGSGVGIKALIGKSADIADSSRKMKDDEITQAKAAGVNPVEHIVAYDGIAVIVNPNNPLTEISLQKISDMYSGQIKSWDEAGAKGLGTIQLINRESSSGTYEAFKEMAVQLHGKAKDRDYAAEARNQPSTETIVSVVAQEKGAIGYVGLGYVNDTVKVLKVIPAGGGAAVAADDATVLSNKYPISRPLYMYTDGEPSGIVKDYLDFVKSEAGQAIVKELGFVPLKSAAAAEPKPGS